MKANIVKKKYLLFRAQNKDAEAFSQVYDLYVERIYRFIYFKVRTKEDAQDLTSEVFLKTWQYIIDGNKVNNLNALFYRIARNLVIDHYRKATAKNELSIERDDLEQKQVLLVDEVEKIETKIRMENIADKLKDLKDEYREVIILRFVEGLSIGEIAQVSDKKKGAVRITLYRALNALRSLMGEKEAK
jgi:RNA polymerase sigma-70 factor, ECF subfamily